VKLMDSIVECIGLSCTEGLDKANDLIQRLKERRFYRQVGPPRSIPTEPRCGSDKCGKPTHIDDRFCRECGKDTKDRPHDLKHINGAMVFIPRRTASARRRQKIF